MRAPNGQSFSLLSTLEYSLSNICDVLRRCSEEFESAVLVPELLLLTISVWDEKVLLLLYKDEDVLATGKIFMLLNTALERLKMPYAVTMVMRAVGTPRLYCKIVRYNWDQPEKICR